MKRLIGITLVVIAIPLVLVFGTAARSGGGSGYKVRAIFDFVRAVPGEDVKIAGAKVGTIESLDVAPGKKAAVVLDINKAGFSPFHQDAHCTIRPQSLIGETFAECSPGSNNSPELPKITSGPGKGQHLLTVEHTSSPVDIDEINDIYREPTRERLAILINEFGTALAGRGKDLNTVIHRANPALRDTDKVLAILAQQNRTLANLARSSDRVLAPLAARRQQVADFIVQANKTAQATAERRADISAGIKRFPAFLRQLRPTLADLGSLSDQMTPVIRDLGTAAPGLNRFIEQLGPFSKASIPALDSLGQAALVGRPALVAARPISTDLARFATFADPVSKNLDLLTHSLAVTGAVFRFMDFLYFQMTAINGFDSIGHYLRAGLIANTCSTYNFTTTQPGCGAKFAHASSSTAGSAFGAQEANLLRKGAALESESKRAQAAAPRASMGTTLQRFLAYASQPSPAHRRNAGIQRLQAGAQRDASPAFGQSDPALNYLLGP